MQTNLLNEILQTKKLEISEYLQESDLTNKSYKNGLTHDFFSVKKNNQSFKIGDYSIVNYPNLMFSTNAEIIYLVNFLAKIIKTFLGNVNAHKKYLIVGLGNRNIVADSLGVEVVKRVMVTNHIKKVGSFLNLPSVFAICPSVFGLTGVESSDIITGVVNQIKPDKIMVIDTLCASNYERLGTSFQVNNAGIVPGGGIGNARKKINKKSLNAEVISIGVPLVVYAKTFLEDAYEKTIKNKLQEKNKLTFNKMFHELNKNCFQNMVVTVKDIEELMNKCAYVISRAINLAVTNYTLDEQDLFFKNLNNKY